MNLVILKYNAGNVHSVELALRRLGVQALVTDDVEMLRSAEKVIFPGVGEASSAMAYLRDRRLDELMPELRQPFLGICLGLQLMCRSSEENNTRGMGLFDAQVKKFPPGDKVPHMGWNSISSLKGPLFRGIPENSYVYFVHSYYAEINPMETARCEYIVPFSAAMQKDTFYAVQFHPEKSGEVGQQILRNFLEL